MTLCYAGALSRHLLAGSGSCAQLGSDLADHRVVSQIVDCDRLIVADHNSTVGGRRLIDPARVDARLGFGDDGRQDRPTYAVSRRVCPALMANGLKTRMCCGQAP